MPPENRAATLARVDEFERDGVRVAFEATADNGYPEELRGDRHRFEAWRARWLANDPASFAAVYRMLANMDLTPELPSIKCPVLVIGGEFDRGRPPSRVEPIAKAIPGAQVQGAARPGTTRAGRRRSWSRREIGPRVLDPRRCVAGLDASAVAAVPKITLACAESTPPLPCTIATSCFFTCRAPHSPRNWRTPSIRMNSPYMPGWQYESPPPLVFTGSLPPGAMLPPDDERPALALPAEAEVFQEQDRVDGEGVVELHHVAVFRGQLRHLVGGLARGLRAGDGQVRHARDARVRDAVAAAEHVGGRLLQRLRALGATSSRSRRRRRSRGSSRAP